MEKEKTPPTIEETAAAEVAALTPGKAPKGISEEAIAAKVKVGLTRDQAIEVIQRQQEHDAATKGKPAKAK